VRAGGQLVFDDLDLMVDAAMAGWRISYIIKDPVTRRLAAGSLPRFSACCWRPGKARNPRDRISEIGAAPAG